MSDSTISKVEAALKSAGITDFGLTELKRPMSFAIYQEWLDHGYHGEMNYLKEHLPQKEEPARLLPRARGAIVVAHPYIPHPEPEPSPLQTVPSLKIAAYARGKDYHFWLKDRLDAVALQLKEIFPKDEFLTMTDSHPVMERDLAFRAGLGWFGKNTCLIQPRKGSYFLLGEIYTTLAFIDAVEPVHDFCGTCTRCIEACPTQALTSPRQLDARRCISYWTIEARGLPPEELRTKFDGWFFGCDICQAVCPWNEKALRTRAPDRPETPDREQLIIDLRFILSIY